MNNWFHKWGPKADKAIHAYYADKPDPYDTYGFVFGRQRRSMPRLPQSLPNTKRMAHLNTTGGFMPQRTTPSVMRSN